VRVLHIVIFIASSSKHAAFLDNTQIIISNRVDRRLPPARLQYHTINPPDPPTRPADRSKILARSCASSTGAFGATSSIVESLIDSFARALRLHNNLVDRCSRNDILDRWAAPAIATSYLTVDALRRSVRTQQSQQHSQG
jgi:hypothetical protein